jgi:putative endonuclease
MKLNVNYLTTSLRGTKQSAASIIRLKRIPECFNYEICFYLHLKMQRGGTVYIMASVNNKVLYTGVTSDLYSRVSQHKDKIYSKSFTASYNCQKLVYYSSFSNIEEAIAEEKRIKGGSRKNKEILINSMNPEWTDLWNDIKDW